MCIYRYRYRYIYIYILYSIYVSYHIYMLYIYIYIYIYIYNILYIYIYTYIYISLKPIRRSTEHQLRHDLLVLTLITHLLRLAVACTLPHSPVNYTFFNLPLLGWHSQRQQIQCSL